MVTFEPVTLAPGVRFPDRELLFGVESHCTNQTANARWWSQRLPRVSRCMPDPLRGESEKIGTIQRRLAWPLRKDDTHKSRMYHFFDTNDTLWCSGCCSVLGSVARVCDPSGDQATVEWLAVPSVPSRAYSEVCPSEGRGDQRLPA